MSRTGPAHYHQGSPNICHCAYSDVYHHTSAPYVYPQRPRAVPGHPSDYAPAVRRVPKPKPTTKLAKSRDLKFDEDGWQWYFETKEAPGVRWRETVWNVEDLPQAKDADYHAMVYEYYMARHVIDEPDRDKLPVMPGGLGKKWRYKRAPPPSAPRTPEDYSPRQEYGSPPQPYTPPPQQYASPSQGYSSPQYAYAEPLYQRHPAAPTYASGSAHPVSMRLPPGADGWRTYSNELPPPPALSSPHESYSRTLGPLPGAPGPRRFVDASLPGGHPYDPQQGYQDEDSYDEDEDRSESEYEPRERAYIPPPSPRSRRRAQKLRERGFRVVDPHNNAELDALEAQARHARSSSVPNLAVSAKIEIHRLLQPRTTLGLTRMPDLVFDLRYDPRHAFDRKQNDGKPDLMNAPAFQPGQEFVRLVIRHPFNGRVGEWVQDMGEARYMTVMDVLMVISDMIHANIDQTHDWEALSEFDKSFVYEAYLNRPCPDEDATGKRLHLFCEKYMFGGMEQLPPKAKGTTAQGPSFLVKLIKNSKHKRYDKIVGFRTPSNKSRAASGHSRSKSSSGMTFPYLASDGESSRRTEG